MSTPPKTALSAVRPILALALLATAFANFAAAEIVRFSFNVGDVYVRLYPEFAPNSVANFLNYVDSDRYEGTFIHRVPQSQLGGTSNFVVQGGGFLLNDSIFSAEGIVTDDPVGDEYNSTNTRGTLSFAKNSLGATSQWFFNIGDNSFLDEDGFTVFGRVVGDGMDVVDLINNLDTVNASSAEDVPGEDFDEVPVLDFDTVVDQQDITNADAVMLNSVAVMDFPPGDYDFDGDVDANDLAVLESNFDVSVFDDFVAASADSNGDAVVDILDLDVISGNFGFGAQQNQDQMALALATQGVPEPSALALLSIAILGRFARPNTRG